MPRFDFTRVLWLILAALALIAASVGVAKPAIYDGVLSEGMMPGVFTQDILAIVSAVALAALALFSKERQLRHRASVHGLLAFFLYAYGIYAIERVYNWFYPLYLAIFAMSLFVLIYSVATVPRAQREVLSVRPSVCVAGAVYGILIAVMFNVIWLVQLVPLLQARERVEYFYSIYIIDLGLVMPAFVIAAVMALRRHFIGLMGLPALFVLGVGILSPLALAEIIKPFRYDMAPNWGEFWLYCILTLGFAVFAAVFLASYRISPSAAEDGLREESPPHA
ncbi:MAG: hypothetical protein GF331_07075 [Chitinivibrionales bacterium]|nr:hypothetical protein [Chitinivibrionales bacterium]